MEDVRTTWFDYALGAILLVGFCLMMYGAWRMRDHPSVYCRRLNAMCLFEPVTVKMVPPPPPFEG